MNTYTTIYSALLHGQPEILTEAEIEFRRSALRRVEEAGYLPAMEQRDLDWNNVREWMDRVLEPGFRWLSIEEQSGTQYILLGENRAIASGQHRIVAGLLAGVPVPDEAISFLSCHLPTRPWQIEEPSYTFSR